MQALELLLNRTSTPRLFAPAPNAEQLNIMYRVGLRAPDHGQIRPWRFLTITGTGLEELGELYAQALLQQNPQADDDKLKRMRSMPLRAPLVVVAIACLRAHPKVPEYEQLIAAGCAVHGMLLAAQAQGFGGFWRSGEMAGNAYVSRQLGLADNEQVIGYLYIGTPAADCKPAAQLLPDNYVSCWPVVDK